MIVKRRGFLGVLGGAAAAWPLAARAQQLGRVRRIGVIMGDFDSAPRMKAFKSAWPALGWVDGRNARFDIRWGAGNDERYRMLATELVALSPDVILAASSW